MKIAWKSAVRACVIEKIRVGLGRGPRPHDILIANHRARSSRLGSRAEIRRHGYNIHCLSHHCLREVRSQSQAGGAEKARQKDQAASAGTRPMAEKGDLLAFLGKHTLMDLTPEI